MSERDSSFGVAIGYLMFGIAGGLGLDLCAKWLLADYSLEQFVFLRSIIGLAIFFSIGRWYGGIRGLGTKRWIAHLLRTALACGAMFGFFFGLKHMPLVNALTLAFTAPLIVTALSVPLLGESVGWRRWLAVIVGFIGVLMVLRPGTGMFTPAAIAVLIAAVCYAGLAISARILAATETSYALSVYVVLGPLVASCFLVPGNYVPPTTGAWALFLLAGLCSVCAWIGIVGSYSRAPPSLLAPFEYTALIGAAAAGYFIWNEIPDRWVVGGGAVIIASGLYIVYREVGGASTNRYLRVFTASGAAAISRLAQRGKKVKGER
ncbi:MAG: DMT family transporter [Gammaproteobacteria bacterium]|nr:DMT family transporter [Gammaproteobacteria bacterium]